jgi:signal transduction histidine kinase
MSGSPAVEPGVASRRRPALTRTAALSTVRDLTRSTPERTSARRRAWTLRVAVADLAVALALDVLTALPPLHDGESRFWVWLLDQALVLPLALRRRHPTAVFAVVAALACVQWLNGVKLPADAALILALYTVAAHERRARAVAAAVLLEAGVVLASVRFAPTGDGIVGSLVFLTGLVAAAFLLGTSLQTRSAYLASLEDRARRLEIERDQQARLVRVAERTRIAREMHDIVAHNLSVMITLAAGAAARTPTHPAEAAQAMEQVAVTGRDALEEMRQLLGFLREDGQPTGIAPQPGLDQLDDLLAQVRSTGLPVRFSVQGEPQPMAMTTELTVYRAVQEALTNTRKHGRDVTGAAVLLNWKPGLLELEISDDGATPTAVPGEVAGMGLAGMRERVTASGGTWSAAPGNGRGWRVRVRLPLSAGDLR